MWCGYWRRRHCRYVRLYRPGDVDGCGVRRRRHRLDLGEERCCARRQRRQVSRSTSHRLLGARQRLTGTGHRLLNTGQHLPTTSHHLRRSRTKSRAQREPIRLFDLARSSLPDRPYLVRCETHISAAVEPGEDLRGVFGDLVERWRKYVSVQLTREYGGLVGGLPSFPARTPPLHHRIPAPIPRIPAGILGGTEKVG